MSFVENPVVQDLLIIIFAVALSAVTYYVVKRHLLKWLYGLFHRTSTKWDDVLFEQGVFDSVALLVPGILMYRVVPLLHVLGDNLGQVLQIWVMIVVAVSIDRVLKGGLKIYNSYPIADRMPVKGYVQIIQIALWIFTGTAILSALIGQSPWILLSGLGALSAILILVFQDTILSFIAGLQLTMNDQVRVGDWIEMPQYGADGDVEEVALHTIKVRNWDKSITTIPTHKLVGDSFKNWRGMFESGGRRIKRSILIDQTSIDFLNEEQLAKLQRIHLIQNYLAEKIEEIAKYNDEHQIDTSSLVNGRHLTNLGTFRAYLMAYLRSHPEINQDMILLVRQLQPTTNGLPLEIYVFTKDVAWVKHESVQADIFDHILSVVPQFGLRVFQNPGGHDLVRMGVERST